MLGIRRTFASAIALAFALVSSAPAFAADNAIILTPGTGVTLRTKDIGGGVQSPINILGDTSGVPIYGTAGSANANVITVQGIASGVTLPISAAALPLPTGAATQTTLATLATQTTAAAILSALGTPLQAGGTVVATQGTGTNLHMVCDSGCSGAGGTSSTFGAAFPSVGTAIGWKNASANMVEASAANPFPVNAIGLAKDATYTSQTGSVIMGLINTTAPTGGADGTLGFISQTTARALRGDNYSWGGTALGAASNWGTSPGAVAVAGVNANVLAITAGETHIGEVGSNQIKVDVAPTVTASAYSTGNAIGGLLTVANAVRVSNSAGASGTGGILTGLQLNMKSAQTVQVDVFLFDANPTGSTCTDKTAFNLVAADFNKVVGILTIPGTAANGAGWFAAATGGSVGIPTYFPVSFDLASSTTLYACAVARGAFTPASTTDASFKFNVLRS